MSMKVATSVCSFLLLTTLPHVQGQAAEGFMLKVQPIAVGTIPKTFEVHFTPTSTLQQGDTITLQNADRIFKQKVAPLAISISGCGTGSLTTNAQGSQAVVKLECAISVGTAAQFVIPPGFLIPTPVRSTDVTMVTSVDPQPAWATYSMPAVDAFSVVVQDAAVGQVPYVYRVQFTPTTDLNVADIVYMRGDSAFVPKRQAVPIAITAGSCSSATLETDPVQSLLLLRIKCHIPAFTAVSFSVDTMFLMAVQRVPVTLWMNTNKVDTAAFTTYGSSKGLIDMTVSPMIVGIAPTKFQVVLALFAPLTSGETLHLTTEGSFPIFSTRQLATEIAFQNAGGAIATLFINRYGTEATLTIKGTVPLSSGYFLIPDNFLLPTPASPITVYMYTSKDANRVPFTYAAGYVAEPSAHRRPAAVEVQASGNGMFTPLTAATVGVIVLGVAMFAAGAAFGMRQKGAEPVEAETSEVSVSCV